MVGYFTNSVSIPLLLSILLLLPRRETECFKPVKGPAFRKKSAVTWGYITIDNASALKAAYSVINKQKGEWCLKGGFLSFFADDV